MKNGFDIDSRVVDSALRYGILVKLPNGTWKDVKAQPALSYVKVEGFEGYILVYTETQIAQDAKAVQLSKYQIDWDVKRKIWEE